MAKTLEVLLAGGPAEEAASASGLALAGAPAAAMDMRASEGAVSSERAVSSGVGAAAPSMCSRRKRCRGKQPAKETRARA